MSRMSGRHNLGRHASYIVTAFVAGAAWRW
ncbi:MAG: hypothetical protein JWO37_428 [Acidimicrobiales bacterium]|jgi:hypothetical protein|nr:hypothetical protein [Acidimicrobiales bacterium]